MPLISALGRLRQEEVKFKSSLGYIAKPCLNNNNYIEIPMMSYMTKFKITSM
jgi:hypothetical protein